MFYSVMYFAMYEKAGRGLYSSSEERQVQEDDGSVTKEETKRGAIIALSALVIVSFD